MVGCRRRSEAGSQGGLLLYPPKRGGGEFWSLQHGGVIVVLIRPIGNQSWQRKRGELVGSILDQISEVVSWGGSTGYIPTNIAGDSDSRYGEIVVQKGSAEISISAQILLSEIRFVPFSYIRISCWFCNNVSITARFKMELLGY